MKKFDIEEVMKRNEEDKFKFALSLVSHIFRNIESFSTQREVVNLILANSEDEEDACNLATHMSYIKQTGLGFVAHVDILSDKEIRDAYEDCSLGYITKEEEDELAHKLFVYTNSKTEGNWTLMSILSPAMEEEWMDIKSFVLLMLAVIDAIIEE